MVGLGVTTALTALALAIGVFSSDAGVAEQARIRVADPAPLTLRGVGFERYERIRLTVSLGERTVVRRLPAGRAGGFTTVFEAMRYDRCSGSLGVKAVGSGGSRVDWELVPLECPERVDS
jgi:hypothetical protein